MSYLFPVFPIPFNVIRQWTESVWSHSHESLYVFPALIWQPREGFGARTLFKRNVAFEEEIQLLGVKLSVCLHNLDGHLEWKEQLVAFKQT